MAKARTSQLVDNINAIKVKLGSQAKSTSCYLADIETKLLVPLRPIPHDFPDIEPRFATRKELATDYSHYSQKVADLEAQGLSLSEKEATEEKVR